MTIVDDEAITSRIAARLRARRLELGHSLAEVATASGVSKAMIAKVERGAASPTAGVLGRLCAGLGITMSALMAAVEGEDATRLAAADQPVWRDPDSGLERTAVSPRTPSSAVEVARLRLPAGAAVAYPAPPSVAHGQHIVGIRGRLRFTVGDRSFDVDPGDCVAARIDRPTRLEALGDEPAEYLVVVDGAGR